MNDEWKKRRSCFYSSFIIPRSSLLFAATRPAQAGGSDFPFRRSGLH
jgi:hypothetical protein